MKMLILFVVFMSGATSIGSSPIKAEDDFEWAAFVGGVQDHRERGLTLTDYEPSATAFVRLDHASGLRGETQLMFVNDGRGRDFWVQNSLSYGFSESGFDFRLKADLDSFHGEKFQGGDSVFYESFGLEVARDFGLVFFASGVQWSPSGRWNRPANSSVYTYFDLEYPFPNIPQLTLLAHAGYDVRGGLNDGFDWSLGASVFIGQVELIAKFEDSNIDEPLLPFTDFNAGEGRVTGAIRFYF